MEVLSNKEICILLNILSNEELMNGLTSIFKLDPSYKKEDVEHLKKEINRSANSTKNDIIQIKESCAKYKGAKLNYGYNVRIFKPNAIFDYATNYVNALINGSLAGETSEIKLTTLFKEFYLLIKDKSDLKDHISKNLKYMPVILFAYINKLIDFKFIFNENDELCEDFPGTGNCSYRFKLNVNGEIANETQGTFYISDTTSLKDIIITLGIGKETREIDVNTLLKFIAEERGEKLPIVPDSQDDKANINRLKNLKLTPTEINIIRACKYLMLYEYNEGITNDTICRYLHKNGNSETERKIINGTIRELTSDIKNKCGISDTRGIIPIVQALELRGYIIPPLMKKE